MPVSWKRASASPIATRPWVGQAASYVLLLGPVRRMVWTLRFGPREPAPIDRAAPRPRPSARCGLFEGESQ